jgi:predicted glycogen debranching enzyme
MNYDSREWIETNGGGAYSSSTISGANTRVYHGLLVASLNQPVDRYVVLSYIEESVNITHEQNISLSTRIKRDTYQNIYTTNQYKLAAIKHFSVFPVTTWVYELDKSKTIKKQIVMPRDKQTGTTVVGYTYDAPSHVEPVTLKLKPYFTFRDFHSNVSLEKRWKQIVQSNKIILINEACPNEKVYFQWNQENVHYTKRNELAHRYFYIREEDRKLGSEENNLWMSGVFTILL